MNQYYNIKNETPYLNQYGFQLRKYTHKSERSIIYKGSFPNLIDIAIVQKS